MNNLESTLFPSSSGLLNELTTNTAPDIKKEGRCDNPENCLFSGHSTSSCKPEEDLIIKDKNAYGHQQSKLKLKVDIKDSPAVPRGVSELSQPKTGSFKTDAGQNRHFSSANSAGSDGKRPPKRSRAREDSLMTTIKKLKKQNPHIDKRRKVKLFKSLISAQNTATHSEESKSVTQSPLNQTENDELLAKREKDRVRKALYRKTPEGRQAAIEASRKYRSTAKGKKKISEYQARYKKSPRGIISSAISNAKSNATVSALHKGQGMREARRLGTEAAKDEKEDLLKVFHIPWLQK